MLCPVVSQPVLVGDSQPESYQIHGVPVFTVVSQHAPLVIPSPKVTKSMVSQCCVLWCPSLSWWVIRTPKVTKSMVYQCSLWCPSSPQS